MKKGYWIALGLVLVLALGLFAAACGGDRGDHHDRGDPPPPRHRPTPRRRHRHHRRAESTDTTAANTTPLKIGIAISLTGDSAAPCEQIKQGFDTEAKFINANGGINGRQVELIYVDDQSKMDTAVAAIQSLVDQKVDVIIGPFPQWTQAPTRDITEKAGILHIAFGPPTLAELNADQTPVHRTPSRRPPVLTAAPTPIVKEMQADGKKNVLAIGDQMVISQETLKVLDTEPAGSWASSAPS